MRFKVCLLVLTLTTTFKTKAQSNFGYLSNIYGVVNNPENVANIGNIGNVDNIPAASQFYNPTYTTQNERLKLSTGLSQYQQIPSPTQDTAYSHHLSPYSYSPSSHQRFVPFSPSNGPKPYQSPSETIITPVQHSTVIHHTPYISSYTSQSPPYVGKLVYLNNKPPTIHVQPLQQSRGPAYQQQQHPLQKPTQPQHLQQYPQKFNPSQSVYPYSHPYSQGQVQGHNQGPHQGPFVPLRHPTPANVRYINNKPPASQESLNSPEEQEENEENHQQQNQNQEDKESEDLEEENEDSNDSNEDKGEINEENDDEEDSEEVGRYQDDRHAEENEESEDDDEEERPKYTNYSFHFNSPQTNKKKKQRHQENDDEDDDEDARHGGYRTHESVEEDDEEDSDDDSSRINYKKYVKKAPKGFTKFDKFALQQPVYKYTLPSFKPSTPIKQQHKHIDSGNTKVVPKFDYEKITFTTPSSIGGFKSNPRPNSKTKPKKFDSRGKYGSGGRQSDIEGRPSKLVSVQTSGSVSKPSPTASTKKTMYREKWFIMKQV